MTPEGAIKRACAEFLAILRRQGLLDYWYNHSTGLYTNGKWRKRNSPHDRNGVADIAVLLKNSVSLWIEVKAPGKIQSPEQIEFEASVKHMGHEYLLVKSPKELVDGMKKLFEKYNVQQSVI